MIAVKLDGKDVSPYGKHVQEAILLGPTIYPLVFAALGGRALRKIALWRAGEGTTLGVSRLIEICNLLLTSRSFWNTY